MITVVSGTNRKNNNSIRVANHYLSLLQKKGVDCALIDLKLLPDNFIKSDMYGERSSEFKVIQELVNNSEKFVFVAPEYNGSFPGILKTFIDACDYPHSFKGKKAALVGVSTGRKGNILGLEHLTGILHYLKVQVLPNNIYINSVNNELDENKEIHLNNTIRYIDSQINQFIDF